MNESFTIYRCIIETRIKVIIFVIGLWLDYLIILQVLWLKNLWMEAAQWFINNSQWTKIA